MAHRLGIAQLKWELEDLAFRYLAPERYKEIASLLNEKRLEREQYIQFVVNKLKSELALHGIEAEISGRVKHIYSIYRKMKSKNLSFDQLYDIRALRVLVQAVPECYHTLGIVHQIWRHIPHRLDENTEAGYCDANGSCVVTGCKLGYHVKSIQPPQGTISIVS